MSATLQPRPDRHGTARPERAERTRRRGSAVAFLTMLALAAGLLIAPPAAPEGATWLVGQGAKLPPGAVVLESIPVADSLVVTAPERPAGAVALDTPLAWRSTDVVEEDDAAADTDPEAPVSLADDSPVPWTGADTVWADGEDGSGAVVALIDTGVAPVEGLEGALAGELDFSGTGGGDGYGHGTFLASLIAARHDTVSGIAPGAGVLSLKVAGDDGDTDLGTVLSALQWLYGPGSASGIRVAVLALGVDPGSPAAEVLDEATERVTDAGILVVTAAGNDGDGQLSSPATGRRSFSTGAVDHRDDTMTPAAFSATGVDRAGVAQPDAYSPGVRVAGWISPGSQIAETHADLVQEGTWLRGSGTSMSAAVTGGVAALVASARPDVDAEGLDRALRAGDQRLDAAAAVAAAMDEPVNGDAKPGKGPEPAGDDGKPGNGPKAPGDHGKGKGKGPDAALKAPVEMPKPLTWTPARWESVRWAGGAWESVRWAGNSWESVRWANADWASVRWASVRWASVRWAGDDWRSVRWAGDDWESVRWADGDWHSVRWADGDWHSVRWADDDWRSVRWADGEWRSVRWASVRWAGDAWGSVRWADATWQ